MPILIGYLQNREEPDRSWRVYTYASFTKMEGHEFICFRPEGIRIHDRTVVGKMFENNRWEERTTRLPDVVYYEPPGALSDDVNENLSQLRTLVPFTSHSIGPKPHLYKRLKAANTFAEYVIPYEKVWHEENVVDFIDQYGKTVLKPSRGQGGHDILFIHRHQDDYVVEIEGQQRQYNKEQFIQVINETINRENYIMQKYIQSKTKDGNSFDLRLHMQKNGEGNWDVLTIVPRIAPRGTSVSNVGLGGLTGMIDPFLNHEFGNEGWRIKKLLYRFGVELSRHLDEIDEVAYDELGIDIGLDEHNKIWIFEVNWKPGEPPFESHTNDIIKNAVRYAVYLAKQSKREKWI